MPKAKSKPAKKKNRVQVDSSEGSENELYIPTWDVRREDTIFPQEKDERRVGREMIRGFASLPRNVGSFDNYDADSMANLMCCWIAKVIIILSFLLYERMIW